MSVLKKLAGQTAIYGLSSIVGRMLNYLLVPFYTYIFTKEGMHHFGVISELYVYIAFLMVVLTFGMETTYFRFLNLESDKKKVFNNSFLTVILINALVLVPLLLMSDALTEALVKRENTEYVVILLIIVAIDAITSLPLAKLRAEERPKKFAVVQLSSIGVNILLNLILLISFVDKSNLELGILLILIANLISSGIKPVLLYKDFLAINWKLDWQLTKKMFKFGFPIAIAGLAFVTNEMIDRVLLKQIISSSDIDFTGYPDKVTYAETQVGIYSACYKLAMLVTIFLQAYRYAAEPFFFAQEKSKDKNKTYVKVMNYFVAAMCMCFLGVTLNIDIFKWFIANEAYHVGLYVVPILLLANVFSGIYINQSIWYKLSNQTKFGAYIAVFGALGTIVFNVLFIPVWGFTACAWVTLFVYGGQMTASYFLGQKHYPIPYNIRKFGLYMITALMFYFIVTWVDMEPSLLQFCFNNFFLLLFLGLVWFMEKKVVKSK